MKNRNLIIGGGLFIAITVALIALFSSINLERAASDRSTAVNSELALSATQIADLEKANKASQDEIDRNYDNQNKQLTALANSLKAIEGDLSMVKDYTTEYFEALVERDSLGNKVRTRYLTTHIDSSGDTTYYRGSRLVPDSLLNAQFEMVPQNRVGRAQEAGNSALFGQFIFAGYDSTMADSLYRAVIHYSDWGVRTNIIINALANAPGLPTQTAVTDTNVAALKKIVSDLTVRMDQMEKTWTKQRRINQDAYNKIIKEEHPKKYNARFKKKTNK